MNRLKSLNLPNIIYGDKIQEIIHIYKKTTALVEELLIEITNSIYDNKVEINNKILRIRYYFK